MTTNRCWILGLLLLCMAVPLAAQRTVSAVTADPVADTRGAPSSPDQTPDQTTTIKVSTRRVVLDVVVTDAKGRPVTDLKKEDFTVVEDNVPQQIRNFDPPGSHQLPAGEVVHSTADLKKIGNAPVDILVLDELNTPFEDNAYSLASVRKFLKAQPATMPPTELLIANDTGFYTLLDFTQSLAAVEDALKRKQVQYPWRLVRNGNSGSESVVRLAQMLNALEEIAQASAGTAGRKNIIWVGKGFPAVDLMGMDAAPAQELQNALKRCSDLLLASRVTLYVIDPTPLSSATYDAETPQDLATLEQETLTEPFSNAINLPELARLTGGRLLSARNDIDSEIATAIQDGSLYYTLAYRPSDASAVPGSYRSVRIALDRPGLLATTRNGYYVHSDLMDAPPPVALAAKPPDSTEVADVARAAMSRIVYNGLAVHAAKVSAGRYSLSVEDASLTWQSTSAQLPVTVVAVAAVCFSADGKVLAHSVEERTLTRSSTAWSPGSSENFTASVSLPPRTARVRFVVREAVSGRLGTVDVDHP